MRAVGDGGGGGSGFLQMNRKMLRCPFHVFGDVDWIPSICLNNTKVPTSCFLNILISYPRFARIDDTNLDCFIGTRFFQI